MELVLSFLSKKRFDGLMLGYILGLMITFAGVMRPAYNWDMIGYVASALHQQGLRDEILRSTTFNEVQRNVPPVVFNDLTTGFENYRDSVYADHKSLTQQIPFYSIRIVYVTLMRVATLFGLNLVQASYFLSALFAGAIGFLIFILMGPMTLFEMFLITFILELSSILQVANLSTPDSMAAFFAILTIVTYFKKSRFLYFLMILLPAVRTDFIILSGIVSMLSFADGERSKSILAIIGAFIVYFLINKIQGNYGHLTLFHFSFSGYDPYPLNMKLTYDLETYYTIYLRGGKEFFHTHHSKIYFLYIGTWLSTKPKMKVKGNELFIMVIAFLLIHLLLFPAYYERHFFWCALIAAIHMYVLLIRDNSPSTLFQSSP